MAFICSIIDMPQLRRSNWNPRNPKQPKPPIIEPVGRAPVKAKSGTGFGHIFIRNMPAGPRGKGRKAILYRYAGRRNTARAVRVSRYTRNAPAQRGIPLQHLPVYRGDRRQGRAGTAAQRGTRAINPQQTIPEDLS